MRQPGAKGAGNGLYAVEVILVSVCIALSSQERLLATARRRKVSVCGGQALDGGGKVHPTSLVNWPLDKAASLIDGQPRIASAAKVKVAVAVGVGHLIEQQNGIAAIAAEAAQVCWELGELLALPSWLELARDHSPKQLETDHARNEVKQRRLALHTVESPAVGIGGQSRKEAHCVANHGKGVVAKPRVRS